MNRRAFLALAVLAPLAACESAPRPRLTAAFFADLDVAPSALTDYIGRFAASPVAELEHQLLGTTTDPTMYRSAIEQQIAADFAGGRTLRVDGWVFAESEVKLWAIYVALAG